MAVAVRTLRRVVAYHANGALAMPPQPQHHQEALAARQGREGVTSYKPATPLPTPHAQLGTRRVSAVGDTAVRSSPTIDVAPRKACSLGRRQRPPYLTPPPLSSRTKNQPPLTKEEDAPAYCPRRAALAAVLSSAQAD
jgi:hypothetical protein